MNFKFVHVHSSAFYKNIHKVAPSPWLSNFGTFPGHREKLPQLAATPIPLSPPAGTVHLCPPRDAILDMQYKWNRVVWSFPAWLLSLAGVFSRVTNAVPGTSPPSLPFCDHVRHF